MKNRKPKKYQSVITRRIFQSVKKLSAVVLMALSATSILAVGGTNAGFSDIEESNGNVWAATSLDARASYIEYFSVVGMDPEQEPDSRITFRNVGELDFRYRVAYRQTGGDDTLCGAFLLSAKRNGVTVYTGLLQNFDKKDFSSIPFEIASLAYDNWDFTVTLPADAGSDLESLSCQWYFDFTAWQTDQPDATTGFSDMESVGPHSIATGQWLTPGDVIINEVMWMGSDDESNDEWIELKNMTSHDIDLSNWDIENGGSGAGHIEIPHGYSIKANGYFLILNNKWDETAVYLTGDLSQSRGYTHVSGMSLHNDGEQLVLEDKDNNMIDQTPVAPWPAGTNGTFKQSMERNDLPGDGTMAVNWHTCTSGAANGAPYWDAAGVNYGTPLAANLSPIVMNEFVLNPGGDDDADRPDGEWIELYNILDEDIDVADWYFTNLDGDQVTVTEDNTDSGTTVVPAKGTLVVYLEEAFLDNTADTLSLYTAGMLPEDASDDVREDTYSYEDADLLPEGKSFARFPDGEGIWLDPEATPGEENVMNEAEVQLFQRLTYDTCFEKDALSKDVTAEICSPIFLTFIGMLRDVDETEIPDAVLLSILDMIRLEEEEVLAVIHEDDETISEEPLPVVEEISPSPEPVEDPIEELPPVEGIPIDEAPVEETPVEIIPETEPAEIPVEEKSSEAESPEPVEGKIPEAKIEEVPADEPAETPIVETP